MIEMSQPDSSSKTPSKIRLTVKSIENKCTHKVGDTIEIVNLRINGFLCPTAQAAIWPYIYAMRHGAKLPLGDRPNKIMVRCPNVKDNAIFEIEKIE